MRLFDKKSGKEYNVPHAVDAKEWLASGKYTDVNPKAKDEEKVEDKKSSSKD